MERKLTDVLKSVGSALFVDKRRRIWSRDILYEKAIVYLTSVRGPSCEAQVAVATGLMGDQTGECRRYLDSLVEQGVLRKEKRHSTGVDETDFSYDINLTKKQRNTYFGKIYFEQLRGVLNIS
jgi:hypothetical protein